MSRGYRPQMICKDVDGDGTEIKMTATIASQNIQSDFNMTSIEKMVQLDACIHRQEFNLSGH